MAKQSFTDMARQHILEKYPSGEVFDASSLHALARRNGFSEGAVRNALHQMEAPGLISRAGHDGKCYRCASNTVPPLEAALNAMTRSRLGII